MIFKKKTITKDEALAVLEEQNLSMEELSSLCIKTLGPLFTNERLTRHEEFELFEKMSAIDGIEEYLRDMMSRDLKRYFAATKDQQDQIRGAYMRAMYFRAMLNRKNADDDLKRPPLLANDRYIDGAD